MAAISLDRGLICGIFASAMFFGEPLWVRLMVRYLGLDVNLNNEGQKIEPLLD